MVVCSTRFDTIWLESSTDWIKGPEWFLSWVAPNPAIMGPEKGLASGGGGNPCEPIWASEVVFLTNRGANPGWDIRYEPVSSAEVQRVQSPRD